jgi:hypothetical protein
MRSRRQETLRAQALADAWNARVAIGQEVDYREIAEAAPRRFRTSTAAEVLSGHTAVVWLAGKSGCVCVTHCVPVTNS